MRFRISELYRLHFVVALLLFVPTTMCGQKKLLGQVRSAFDSRESKWLDKQSVDELENVEKWAAFEAAYADSMAVRDSLKRVVNEDEIAKTGLVRQLDALHSNVKAFWNSKKVSQYDEDILLIHQNLCNDSTFKIMERAMSAFVEADKCLRVKYVSTVVAGIRDSLKLYVSEKYRSEYEEMDNVLEKYGLMTEGLRQALVSANDIRPKTDPGRSQHMTEKYKKEFFAELGSTVRPEILTPGLYPYLYGIMIEAMEAKMKDPCTDIGDIIERL